MKKTGVLLLVLIFLIPLALSLDINIRTLPNHKIDLIVREAGGVERKDGFINRDTGTGKVLITSLVGISEMDLIVNLKKDGKIILNKKFESISTDNPVNINFYPGGDIGIVDDFEKKEEINKTSETEITENPVENLSEEAVEEESLEKTEENIEKENTGSRMIGAVTSSIKSLSASKTIYYVIGGIFVIGVFLVVVFVVRKKINFRRENFKVRKLSEDGYDRRLSDAEKKLDSAKKELDELKNRKKRLMEARERFKRDEEELKRIEKYEY